MIQAAILFLSGLAVWLTTRPNPSLPGFAIGMAAQPLWIFETWQRGQWGMFALSLWFFIAYARGFWHHRTRQRRDHYAEWLRTVPDEQASWLIVERAFEAGKAQR